MQMTALIYIDVFICINAFLLKLSIADTGTGPVPVAVAEHAVHNHENGVGDNNAGKVDEIITKRLLEAIKKTILFYQNNYKTMNLDGIYGLRILESELKSALDKQTKYPLSLTEELRTAKLQATEIAEKSLLYVKESEPNYYKKLHRLIEPQNFPNKSYKRVDWNLKWNKDIIKMKGMTETFSDQCMTELLGEQSKPSCAPTSQCLTFMFTYGHQEYTLLHQILYTLVAEQNGCTHVLENSPPLVTEHMSIADIQQVYCSNNLIEIVDLLNEIPDKKIPDVYQDLFLEQQFVCPSLGYMEFLHEFWLNQILSWQKEEGCFGERASKRSMYKNIINNIKPGSQIDDIDGPQYNYDDNYKGKDIDAGKEIQAWPSDKKSAWDNIHFQHRKLLEEKSLAGGCLSHRTAVAAAALSQYLKFILNPGAPDYQAEVSLNGNNYLLASSWQNLIKNEAQSHNNNKNGQEPLYNYDDVYQRAQEREGSSVKTQENELAIEFKGSSYNKASLWTNYMVITLVMLVILIYMYRFIRKRKIIIRYKR